MNWDILTDWLLVACRLIVAGLCGALVGWERERHEKGAGLRTHTLICLASCLLALIAVRIHTDFHGADVMRVVQGLLLGIGFLAGGVIFTRSGSVQGLTTAAGLWVLTAVGLAVGFGYYFLAVIGTLLTFVIIAGLKQIEVRIHKTPRPNEPKDGQDKS